MRIIQALLIALGIGSVNLVYGFEDKSFPQPMTTLSCVDIARGMQEANDKHIDTKPFFWKYILWMKIPWMGEQEKYLNSYSYVWGKYKLISKNGAIQAEFGEKPLALQAHSIRTPSDVIKILGDPDKIETISTLQYTWACPLNLSRINVTVNNFGTYYSGKYCNYISCRPFNFFINNSFLPISHKAIDFTVKKTNTELGFQETASFFKQRFGVNLLQKQEIPPAAYELIAHYYSKLRQCTPGVYQYPVPNALYAWQVNNQTQPMFFLGTSTISESKEKKCPVETVIKMHNTILRSTCLYSSNSLNSFNNARASAAVKTYFTTDKTGSENRTKTQECVVLYTTLAPTP